MLVIAFLFVFFTGRDIYHRVKEYNLLEKRGIATTAIVSDVVIGRGKIGKNMVSYQFNDLSNRLVKKTEAVGRSLDGKLLKDVKIGNIIHIRFIKKEPSVSHIIDNTGIIASRKLFLLFFTSVLLFISAVILVQIIRTTAIMLLYKHGIETTGTILSKKLKGRGDDVFSCEILCRFRDIRGKVYTLKEKTRRAELIKNFKEGSGVIVLYKVDNPAKSAILI